MYSPVLKSERTAGFFRGIRVSFPDCATGRSFATTGGVAGFAGESIFTAFAGAGAFAVFSTAAGFAAAGFAALATGFSGRALRFGAGLRAAATAFAAGAFTGFGAGLRAFVAGAFLVLVVLGMSDGASITRHCSHGVNQGPAGDTFPPSGPRPVGRRKSWDVWRQQPRQRGRSASGYSYSHYI